MNFEVNGIAYFLTFDTSAEQWFLLKPSPTGYESLEIHGDGEFLASPVPPVRKGGMRHMN
jgi:hypothetical protein